MTTPKDFVDKVEAAVEEFVEGMKGLEEELEKDLVEAGMEFFAPVE